jgi:hypothetical protein
MVAVTSPEETGVPAGEPVLRLVPSTAPDGALSVDELGSRIVGLAGRLAAATCHWLLVVAMNSAGWDQRP